MKTKQEGNMKKQELAELAARALNLLATARANHEFHGRDEDEFNALAKLLPKETEQLWREGYTLSGDVLSRGVKYV